MPRRPWLYSACTRTMAAWISFAVGPPRISSKRRRLTGAAAANRTLSMMCASRSTSSVGSVTASTAVSSVSVSAIATASLISSISIPHSLRHRTLIVFVAAGERYRARVGHGELDDDPAEVFSLHGTHRAQLDQLEQRQKGDDDVEA